MTADPSPVKPNHVWLGLPKPAREERGGGSDRREVRDELPKLKAPRNRLCIPTCSKEAREKFAVSGMVTGVGQSAYGCECLFFADAFRLISTIGWLQSADIASACLYHE